MGANPTDNKGGTEREIYIYIHNVFANFFKDSLDYFSKHLWPRFEFTVIGTYEKAVEYIQKECQYGREISKPMTPALILNPSGDFDLADSNAGGHQLWRFPNLAPGMIKYVFDPVYKDSNMLITVGFIRIQGDIELLMLLNSFYEYCDLRMLLLQVFGGLDRWIYPQYFNTFIILPEELINYQYTNQYTGETYKIDWEKSGAYQYLVRTIGKEQLVIPCNIKPIYKLTGFSDPSTRYGGADAMADWRLGATVHYEIEIPSWLILDSNYLAEDFNIFVNTGSVYSQYHNFSKFNEDVPINSDGSIITPIPELKQDFKFTMSVSDSTTHDIVMTGCAEETLENLKFKIRYFYTVTQADYDSTSDLIITLPEQIEDKKFIVVNSKYGQMTYGDHYVLQNNGNELLVKKSSVKLEVDMVIELYVYKIAEDDA